MHVHFCIPEQSTASERRNSKCVWTKQHAIRYLGRVLGFTFSNLEFTQSDVPPLSVTSALDLSASLHLSVLDIA